EWTGREGAARSGLVGTAMRTYDTHMPRASASPPSRRKSPTNLSIRSDLVRRARSLRLNLSEVLERALTQEIRTRERAAWLAENLDAVEAYNADVETRGVFSEEWRRFYWRSSTSSQIHGVSRSRCFSTCRRTSSRTWRRASWSPWRP